MEKSKNILYCHLFSDPNRGVIKTVKLYLESLEIDNKELKQKLGIVLANEKNKDSNSYKVKSVRKNLLSKDLSDKTKVSTFFVNKDDVYSHVDVSIIPVKTGVTKQDIVDDILSFKTLSKYSFYEATKQIVKVNVSLAGVEKLPKENIKSKFSKTSLEVKIIGLNGVNYCFAVPKLSKEIDPEKSEVRTVMDSIVIRLRKAKEDDHWSELFKIKYVGEKDYD
jgi:hypothetical protein